MERPRWGPRSTVAGRPGAATLRVFAGSPSGRLGVVPQHRKERNVHIASRNLCIRRPHGADHLGQASSARREWTGVEKTGRGTGGEVRAPDRRPKTEDRPARHRQQPHRMNVHLGPMTLTRAAARRRCQVWGAVGVPPTKAPIRWGGAPDTGAPPRQSCKAAHS
jgi:hypothetical protein